jgi:hypothetical protein
MRFSAAFATAIMVLLTGCSHRVSVRPSSLPALSTGESAYSSGPGGSRTVSKSVRMLTPGGRVVDVHSNTTLWITDASGEEHMFMPPYEISLNEEKLEIVIRSRRKGLTRFHAPDIRKVEVEEHEL